MGQFSFKKETRLSSEKLIQELFNKGSYFYLRPFKVLHLKLDRQPSPHQVLISVPARLFKKAVDRNTIKRRIREGFRLNQHRLVESENLLIAYIYQAKVIEPSAEIHKAMVRSIEVLNQRNEKKAE